MNFHAWFRQATACVIALLAHGVLALESDPVVSPRSTVSLLADRAVVTAGETLNLALRLKLASGWHIYWQNPGDAGQPPQIGIHAPAGTTVSDIRWPAPRKHVEGPVTTFIHEGEVVLPFSLTLPTQVSGRVPIVARANWLVCKDICIPEEGVFRVTLPVGQASVPAHAALFEAAAQARPLDAPWAARVDTEAKLTLSGDGTEQVVDAWFVPSSWGLIEHGAAQALTFAGKELTLSMQPGPAFDASRQLSGALLTRDRQGVEHVYRVMTPGTPMTPTQSVKWVSAELPVVPIASMPAADSTAGLPYALLLALTGGLLLNLMPCVFPVLAIKALSFAKLGGHAQRVVRQQSLAYCAGVVATFLLLAGVLLVLRAAGLQAGWGFQFQSPVFVTAMAALLFVIGLNLSGIFNFGSRFASAGGSLASKQGLSGSFFTGALAVVVATPCTAPFMGGALAFALGAPPAQTVAVFVAMGFGLALPYALLAFVPGLAQCMPRPGQWMERLKQALAFPMYAAAAWLVWVLSQQTGADGVLTVLVAVLLLALAAWLLGVAQGGASRGGVWRAGALIAGLMAVIGIARAPEAVPAASRETAMTGDALPDVLPYAPERLSELRMAGKPVFVNMTAAWCVTCLVNEKVALSAVSVKQAFAARGITYMKGDWTRSDPLITDFLRQHGRDGVPLYVYFPPDGAPPTVLPQILTEQIVLGRIGA